MSVKLAIYSYMFLIVYVIIGGVIFHFLEHSSEIDRVANFQDLYTNITQSTCVNGVDVAYLLDKVSNNPQLYVQMSSNGRQMWDILGSTFFSLVVVSTVGFGNQVPTTAESQIAIGVYATLGVPLFLYCMKQASKLTKFAIQNLEKRLPDKLRKQHGMVVAMIFGIGLVIVYILPIFVFHYVEGWSLQVSTYFAGIALSTIGFGDYVPGISGHASIVYRLFILSWMFVGLTYVATVIGYFEMVVGIMFKRIEKGNEKTVVPITSDVVRRKRPKYRKY